MLPQYFDPTGSYNDADYDRTRGYIALVCAEVEMFIESRCLEIAGLAVSNWMSSSTPSKVIVALHAICYSGWSGVLEGVTFAKPTTQLCVEARLADALKQYQQAVGDNHGIKRKNLKALLVPLSIRMSDLDETWLISVDSFGTTRGQIVHQSSVSMTQLPDPKIARETVWKQIVPGLRDLDLILSSLI